MPDLLQQVAEPLIDFTAYTPPDARFYYSCHPAHYDACPDCGNLKSKRSKRCRNCKYSSGRPPIDSRIFTDENGSYRRIPLTRGLYALVDDWHYERLMRFWWTASQTNGDKSYPTCHVNIGKKRMTIAMHRFIIQIPRGMVGDHKNGDGLNNRESNLRVATFRQNMFNSDTRGKEKTSFKGVQTMDWLGETIYGACIGKHRTIAWFRTEIEAAICYDRAVFALRGEWARLNFPDQDDASISHITPTPIFPI